MRAQGSKDWGGAPSSEEPGTADDHVLSGEVRPYNLNGNMKAVKNVIKVPSMHRARTHAGLLVQFTLFFFYISDNIIWSLGAN